MESEFNLSGRSYSSVGITGGISTGTTTLKIQPQYSTPNLIRFDEFEDRLEFIYTEDPNIVYSVFPPIRAEKRVFKIIYSCVDGKWNKSEKIYGTIIPAIEEDYEF
jgi:hypothetical protein